ncbi:hypothetical protein IV203_025263 [Nitzschia inconspicua]|uniref:PrsW family intramembrane metalloprotease n=1 Tax=Nitzschia inconspicua TaxID=303405 RepID=A0A9K3K9Q5_9STRA|nr:hypothetical protein IV203_024731 [Nitzschia inconspicua]KAG7362379.1 hypothetical protein IV203_025263 [Nitzschia inconspicua]
MPRRSEKQSSSSRRGWGSRSRSRGRRNSSSGSNANNNNNNNNRRGGSNRDNNYYDHDDDNYDGSIDQHQHRYQQQRRQQPDFVVTVESPSSAGLINDDIISSPARNSTLTGATGHHFNYMNSPSSQQSQQSPTPQLPTPIRSKGLLTGNISSLFRRASSSGKETATTVPMTQQQQQQQQHGPGYTAPLPVSPPNSAAGRSPPTSPPRFVHSSSSTNNNKHNKDSIVPNQDGKHKHRLFYSNADDDDSQDSFETRTRSGLSNENRNRNHNKTNKNRTRGGTTTSNTTKHHHQYGRYHPHSRGGGGSTTAAAAAANTNKSIASSVGGDTFENSTYGGYTYTTAGTDYTEGSSSYDPSHTRNDGTDGPNNAGGPSTTILRYRGFSTSIKSLFLDEALVCASMGCFGLILSNRTEYLLQLRNDRRGVQWGRSTSRRTLPSRIVAYALLLTLLLIGVTFVVWGFGSDNAGNPFANTWYNTGTTTSSNKNSGSSSSSSSNNNNNNNNYNNNNWDDGWNAVGADDDNNNNNNNNDDDAVANDDGGNNNNNNDDANANNNDDGANNNNNYNYNNGYQQLYSNNGNSGWWNGNYYNSENDDYYTSYYSKYNVNGNNNYNNNGGDRQLDSAFKRPHPVHGVFKIRDMKEGLWEPALDFLSDEWYRPYEQKLLLLLQEEEETNVRVLQSYYTDDATETNDTQRRRDLASDLRFSFFIVFLIVLGVLGRRRRMRTRYYLVRARAQEDHLFYASSGTGLKRVGFQDSREDQYEGACSHTLCGCYPVDPPKEGDEIEDEVQVDDEGVSQRKKKPHNEDCVSRGFNCILGLCCGFICKCWFQCLSICALAQEAREIRLLVPTRFQRIDYITHQPFHEYQKDVNDLRKGWLGKSRQKSGFMPHFNALSRLSRYILTLFIFVTLLIVGTLLFNPRASFSWPDAVILLATFLQSFLVIWIVHWIFHKSDLSLDAVIKMFAAGFVIAVPAAFFFEGLLVNITLVTAYMVYGMGELINGDGFMTWVIQHYRLLWILGEIFNAYVVAAVTEELCKYYTFRCVEHPDLIFLTGLVSTAQDERALEGGVVKYPFSSHQVQRTNQRNPYDDEASQYSRGSHRSKTSKSATLETENDDDMYDEEPDVRTYRQKAAAVTTAMISVAVGLACAENFLYVFLLGGTSSGASSAASDATGGSYLEEWIVLLFRSIFPVHALAAAMQSVNMVRKFVETDEVNGHRIGVGRIILPAVIMHGSFDAILLGINVFIETSWDNYLERNAGVVDPENPPYNPVVVNGVAWFSIIMVMLLGMAWYIRENRNQRARLILLEEQEKAREIGSPAYTSPGPNPSEVELV